MNRQFFFFLWAFLICGAGIFFFKKFRAQPENDERVRYGEHIKHVGIIMDGNRRWAKERGLHPWEGHKKGVESLKAVVQTCCEEKIPYLTVYTFSLENFKRSTDELNYLFKTLAENLVAEEQGFLHQHEVCVHFIGEKKLFPENLRKHIANIEDATKKHDKLHLSILFCYGGRQDIVHALQDIAQKVALKQIEPSAINETLLRSHFWTGSIPDPELIIRTGKAKRLSNFLPFESTYSELYFVDDYWPAFTKEQLLALLEAYSNEKHVRNYGA